MDSICISHFLLFFIVLLLLLFSFFTMARDVYMQVPVLQSFIFVQNMILLTLFL